MKDNDKSYSNLSIKRLLADIIIYIILIYIEIKMIIFAVNGGNILSTEFIVTSILFIILTLNVIDVVKHINFKITNTKKIVLYLNITTNIVYLATTFILIIMFLYKYPA